MSNWDSIPYIWEPRGPYACDECGAPHPPKQCGRCRLAYYCDVECQRAAFVPRHRAVCDASVRSPSLETVLRMASGTGREGSVLGFLWQDEALGLRAASRGCREAVATHAWDDWDNKEGKQSHIVGSVASWRACFPKARTANMGDNKTVTDADFALLEGIHKLNMGGCNQATITNAAFAHLRGIHMLYMGGCNQATITDAAFAHLRGIHSLDMCGCNQATITDAAFMNLRGIHTLYMGECNQATITDVAFAHLRGIHTLGMHDCNQATITDAAFAHLRGVRELYMSGCTQSTISDAAFAHLRGIHTLDIEDCYQITDAAMEQLRGISALDIRGCPKIHAVSRKMLWRANKKVDLTFKEARD